MLKQGKIYCFQNVLKTMFIFVNLCNDLKIKVPPLNIDVGIPLNGLTPPHFCAHSKTGPGFPKQYVEEERSYNLTAHWSGNPIEMCLFFTFTFQVRTATK